MRLIKQNIMLFFNSFAAMFIYGGWAIYANFEHGKHAWLMAGTVQGVYAFISTLTITAIAKLLYTKCGCGRRGIAGGFCVGFIIMLVIPVSVHMLASTPDILETILPGLIWGTGYLVMFLVLTERKRVKEMHIL